MNRRFYALRATRWLPAGLLIPVLLLVLIERDFSLGQIGAMFAAQAIAVFILEIPTGGLADAIGRRPVLLAATVVDIVSLSLLLIAQSLPAMIVAFLLQGVYRALESGPVEAWFVDGAHREDPSMRIEQGLSTAGVITGLSIAVGALVSSLLVTWSPIEGADPLAVPIAVAIALRGVDLVAVATLLTEPRTAVDAADRPSVIRTAQWLAVAGRDVRMVIGETFALARRSRTLSALILLEFFWGFGMTSWETLYPPLLAELAGGTDRAAAILGPATTAGFLVMAIGSGLSPRLADRLGVANAAMVVHALQATSVIAMSIVAGAAGLVSFTLVALAMHGAANPLYQSLLHEQTDSAHRATVLSAASMASHPGFALGGVLLGSLADRASIPWAMSVAALALFATVPLYLPARPGTSARFTRR